MAYAVAGGRRPEPAEEDVDENGQDIPTKGGVEGQLIAEGPRHGEDPLAHGDTGEYVINKVGGQLAHAASATRGTEVALATERDDHLPLTLRAANVNATMFQTSAAQVGSKLADDEGGQGPALFPGGAGQEALEMGLQGAVED